MNLRILLILLLGTSLAVAQENEDLQTIYAKANEMYVTPEALDRLIHKLSQYDITNDQKQDSLLLETYQSIASGYLANNHFKRAYEVYREFLTKKEKYLSLEKSMAIASALSAAKERQKNSDITQKNLQDEVNMLGDNYTALDSKRLLFKRGFSFILIFLTAIFAIMLVSAGIRMLSLRSQLKQSQDKIRKIHSMAVVGALEKGISASFESNIPEISNSAIALEKRFQTHEKDFKPAQEAINSLKEVTAGLAKAQAVSTIK